MTKKRSLRSQSVCNFSKVLFAVLLLSACAKPGASSFKNSSMGRSVASSGVIGGKPAEPSSVFDQKVLYLALGVKIQKDSQGAVHVNWNGICTASAISPDIILTAAHCAIDRKAEELYIILTKNPGVTPLNMTEWYAVKTINVHEGYHGKQDNFQNDLALLRLSKKLPSTKVLKVSDGTQMQMPLPLISVGFGTTSELANPNNANQGSTGLHYVMRTVERFDLDAKTFSINQEDHKGFCSGDSGGPGLTFNEDTKEYSILGVVSNTSMLDSERNQLDPQRQYSLCIGHGNYTNVANPELHNWIVTHTAKLEAQP